MPNDDAVLWTAEDSVPTSDTLRQQIAVIEQSQNYILLIIVSILMSYHVTAIQKKQLQCALCGNQNGQCSCFPDTEPLSLTSNVFVLIAVVFFYQLSLQTANGPHETCAQKRAADQNSLASLFVLLAAILRLSNLLGIRCESES